KLSLLVLVSTYSKFIISPILPSSTGTDFPFFQTLVLLITSYLFPFFFTLVFFGLSTANISFGIGIFLSPYVVL
ncbi:hypothetical protein JIY74_38355, partial [Vibrio harveyi]|nr:hypothetical protein [Vibrio harveyi]MBY7705891.1 hypothetical protein [Vibrio harveyi]